MNGAQGLMQALSDAGVKKGMEVSASRAKTAYEFYAQLKKEIAEPGPHLIEAVL